MIQQSLGTVSFFSFASASFVIVFIGETDPSSAQDNSKSSTLADTEEVQKDVKKLEADDAGETGKMIEEERAETGRVRTLKWRPNIIICMARQSWDKSEHLVRLVISWLGQAVGFDSAFESRQI